MPEDIQTVFWKEHEQESGISKGREADKSRRTSLATRQVLDLIPCAWPLLKTFFEGPKCHFGFNVENGFKKAKINAKRAASYCKS